MILLLAADDAWRIALAHGKRLNRPLLVLLDEPWSLNWSMAGLFIYSEVLKCLVQIVQIILFVA